jgi:hypothetical protein
LDPTDLDDGSHFTRGYSYDISYKLHFITEDGKHIYSKVLKSDDSIFYQELSQDELKSIEDEINK